MYDIIVTVPPLLENLENKVFYKKYNNDTVKYKLIFQ